MNPQSQPTDSQEALVTLLDTVHRLVWPGGCAWHEVQTHETLTPFLIEETAEVIDAIEVGATPEEFSSELADVLYQVLFHAAIAERDHEGFSFTDVMNTLNDKLVSRHPHVFGNRGFMSVEELHAEWERLKEDAAGENRNSRGPLDGIAQSMPTLAKAAKIVERLKRAKLLQDDEQVHNTVLTELLQGMPEDANQAEHLIGDALLALVMTANAHSIDPDSALRQATRRLIEQTQAHPGQ